MIIKRRDPSVIIRSLMVNESYVEEDYKFLINRILWPDLLTWSAILPGSIVPFCVILQDVPVSCVWIDQSDHAGAAPPWHLLTPTLIPNHDHQSIDSDRRDTMSGRSFAIDPGERWGGIESSLWSCVTSNSVRQGLAMIYIRPIKGPSCNSSSSAAGAALI